MSKDKDLFGQFFGGEPERQRRRADDKVLPLNPNDPRYAGFPALPADRAYIAFDTHDRVERLHILRATQPSRFPNYSYLLDIVYDHHLHSIFTLVYTFMLVEVTGANLGPLVHAITMGTCECIREFHPKFYDVPAKDQPCIEAIRITAADEALKSNHD